MCVCVCARDLETSNRGGLGPSRAVAPQEKKHVTRSRDIKNAYRRLDREYLDNIKMHVKEIRVKVWIAFDQVGIETND